jgi:hypothetical protein
MRSVRALVALALAVTFTLAATSAHAAPGDGTVTVTMVDEHGDPMPGAIYLSSGSGFADTLMAASTGTFTVPPGTYGVFAITPWGGMQCVGFDPCDYYAVGSGSGVLDGSVVVGAGQDTPVVVTGEKPVSLSGPGRVGSPLSLVFSDGMSMMMDYLGGYGGAGLAPTVTWLRNGEPIAGEAGETYRPVGSDVGKALSARLEYTGIALAQFQSISGAPVTPRSTQSVEIDRVPTSTFTRMVRSTITTAQRGVARVDATAKNMIVTGKATVKVGEWSVTRALRNGRLTVRLPALKPGTYKVEASYDGTNVFDNSTAKVRTLVVKK